ncbi:hypothetical protein V8E53_001224 [Lactarius tabidus]
MVRCSLVWRPYSPNPKPEPGLVQALKPNCEPLWGLLYTMQSKWSIKPGEPEQVCSDLGSDLGSDSGTVCLSTVDGQVLKEAVMRVWMGLHWGDVVREGQMHWDSCRGGCGVEWDSWTAKLMADYVQTNDANAIHVARQREEDVTDMVYWGQNMQHALRGLLWDKVAKLDRDGEEVSMEQV